MELLLPIFLFLILPLFMLFFFKSNVGIMFLAACTGLVLLSNLDDVVLAAAGSVVPSEGEAYVRLAVVMVSTLFAGFMFRNTVKGLSIMPHFIIALLLSLVLWLILPSVTGLSWLVSSLDQEYWRLLYDYRALLIAAGFALSLAVVHGSKHKKSKSKTKH